MFLRKEREEGMEERKREGGRMTLSYTDCKTKNIPDREDWLTAVLAVASAVVVAFDVPTQKGEVWLPLSKSHDFEFFCLNDHQLKFAAVDDGNP